MQTALVTGCNGGIGRAIVAEFKKQGWSVMGIDLHEQALADLDTYTCADVGDFQEWQRIADQLRAIGYPLHCLVNNAAAQLIKPLVDTSVQDWNRLMNINLNSLFFSLKSLVPLLKGGSVVNISSVHARATSAGMAAYVTSKGGMAALSRAAALEFASEGIRVNCILPGAMDTPMLRLGMERMPEPFEIARDQLKDRVPLKRIGMPGDVATLTYFLADSSLSGYLTGQEFVCDGGVLASLSSEPA